jgi:hypothetical protein
MKKLGFGKQRLGKLFTLSTIGLTSTVLFALVMVFTLPISAFSADKLIVKDSGGNPTFVVEDNGAVYTANYYNAQGVTPGFWLDETGTGNKSTFFVLDNGTMQVQRRGQGFGAWEASIMLLEVNAPSASFTIRSNGNVGFGLWANSHPLQIASGAYCSAGGIWTNASSREYKKEIKDLTSAEAMDTLKGLNPVKFSYKASSDERHVGFIAEDVPELVASTDRKGMSSMDVVAVLTKVVQEQQKTIAELSRKVAKLENGTKLK